MIQCQYCLLLFSDSSVVFRHQAQVTACRKRRDDDIQKRLIQRRKERTVLSAQRRAAAATSESTNYVATALSPMMDAIEDYPVEGEPLAGPALDYRMELDGIEPTEDHFDAEATDPRIVDVPDEEPQWKAPFPKEYEARAKYGTAKTQFEIIRDEQVLKNGEVLGPFADQEEWELVKWLIHNVGHNQTEAFLKLPIVSSNNNTLSCNNLNLPCDRFKIALNHPIQKRRHSSRQSMNFRSAQNGSVKE